MGHCAMTKMMTRGMGSVVHVNLTRLLEWARAKTHIARIHHSLVSCEHNHYRQVGQIRVTVSAAPPRVSRG